MQIYFNLLIYWCFSICQRHITIDSLVGSPCIDRNVRGTYVVPFCRVHISVKTTIYKDLRPKCQLQKDSLQKSDEKNVVSEFTILAQNCLKLPIGKKKIMSWSLLANHLAVHSGVVSKVRVCSGGSWR